MIPATLTHWLDQKSTMNLDTIKISDTQEILWFAIGECRTQHEVTLCALQVHQVCASGSEIESELITRIAAKQIALDLEVMESKRNTTNLHLN